MTSLNAGTKLGRYEIRTQLGAGGMGEVYRARDTQLGRDVAIKVLPAAYSVDQERLRRFEQEACAAGALNHPNILVVHDIAAHDGTPYVVSELLEGETLRKRVGATPLPQRRAIDYALQIAHGLAAAHEKGIIHRDLKPDNIFITNDSRIKILDFGLAKLTEVDGDQAQTDIPTRRVDTNPGVVMGTVGYISPEQLRGRAVDQRSDIFAFGAILYEMLSGRRAFQGESAAETMSAILKEEPPDLSDTNKTVSPALERLVNHCLEKKPEARFHSARDLAFALEALSGGSATSGETATAVLTPVAPSQTRRIVPWVLAAAFVLTTLIFALLYFQRPSGPDAQVTRFVIYPPEKASLTGVVVVSPDGRRVALPVSSEGRVRLWIQALDSLTAQPLGGTEDATFQFWSPDGRSIGFFAMGKLKKIDLSSGSVQTICNAPDARGGTWNRDGIIIFSARPPAILYKVSASGGTPTPLTTLDAQHKDTAHSLPQFFPDGRHFLYVASGAVRETKAIAIGSLDSQETKRLPIVGSNAIYVTPGYILFLRDRTLMAQTFNEKTMELAGEPIPIAENVFRIPDRINVGAFSVSENGVLVYRTGGFAQNQLTWFDRTGKKLGTVGSPYGLSSPAFSPDEKRVVISRADPQSLSGDINVVDLASGSMTPFTFDPGVDTTPLWSPKGDRIIFASDRDGVRNLYQKPATGTSNEEPLLKTDNNKVPTDWSLDGQTILYQDQDPQTNWDLWILPLSGEAKPYPFLKRNDVDIHGRFSPDGKWIVYASLQSGTWQVYVRSFPDSGGQWQVSTNGGAQPRWRNDGKELFYISADRKLMAVEVKRSDSTFEVSPPTPLFDLNIVFIFPGLRNFYVATHDGQRFLITNLVEESTSTPTVVVQNWTAELKK